MNQKLARELRQMVKKDFELFGGHFFNKSDGKFSPKRFVFDEEKNAFVKTRKGVPFSYSLDSPRRIYRDRKKALKRAIRAGVLFNFAMAFPIEESLHVIPLRGN
jgi:hypothetical protein